MRKSYNLNMNLLLSLLLASLALLTISLQKTYSAVPAKELKRRAREGDEFAVLLYRAVSYGYGLKAVLGLLIGLAFAGFFVFVGHVWPTWMAFLLSLVLLWLGFMYLPASRVTGVGERIASWLAPALAWLLQYLHPVLDWIIGFIRRHRPVSIHTGLYDKDDLLDLLDRQQVQPGNRIEQLELEVARHALTFGDRLIRDVMIPRRIVKMVSVEESIGPVLMTELHDSGHSRFPVFEDKEDNIVGTLYLRDLTRAKTGGLVRKIMHADDICYVHEEQPLADALQAVLKTRRQLLVVINGFEEYVGIITIEDVLEQIVGKPILDEFDQYEDLRAVAARDAKVDHKTHVEQEDVLEVTEVIE